MDTVKIIKWIRIIAVWLLFLTVLSAVFYFLIYFKIIDEEFKLRDHIDFFIGTVASLIIFIGLWKVTSWGWKLTIIITSLSCIYSIIDLLIEYESLMGVGTALFIIIDALILRFLFRPDVRNVFNIESPFFIHLNWIPTALFLLAAFLVVTEIFDKIVGTITVIGIYLGLRISKKAKKDQRLKI